jgi:Fic family protein
MVFRTPRILDVEKDAIDKVEEVWGQLRRRVADPRRWSGGLRRLTFTRAIAGSNSIEGYHASVEDVIAAIEDEPTTEASVETRAVLRGYRDAMTYVLQLADDGDIDVDESLLKSLHFMMMKHDLTKRPGRWRTGDIYVRREPTGDVVYEGPRADLVPAYMGELVTTLNEHDTPVLIRAAMAHLNLVMIHPFKDGNGRMARCLQTLVLAREKVVSPVFSSIEEQLGRSTEQYYAVLGDVGQGSWHPENDARLWIRFCLDAHFKQAERSLRRIHEIEDLWGRVEEMVARLGLPPRSVGPLCDASRGLRIYNWLYRVGVSESEGEEIEAGTATRDLKSLVGRGVLQARGEARGRFYVASKELRDIRASVRHQHVVPPGPPLFEGLPEQLRLNITAP